ncbi:hypothetical protein KR222_010522, partial [Zaprionus bogoriensis]
AGILLFAYGGMDFAQSLQWNMGTGVSNTAEFMYSWFIGVIIGALAAALTVTEVPKWVYYALGGIMQLINGIIFVAAEYDYTSIVAARYIGGVGIGLITVVFIIHNSEVTTSTTRGQWAALEQYGLALGIIIQTIMDSEWLSSSDIGLNLAHGIFGIVFSVVATVSVAMSVESPVFHLRRNDEHKARACLWHLLTSLTPVNSYNAALNEIKRYVEEGSSRSLGEELSASVVPFVKMLFCRCLVAFTFSYPISLSIISSSAVSIGYIGWSICIWSVLRWIGTFITIAIVDRVGRKVLSLTSLLCMAALMLATAGIYSDTYNAASVYYMSQVSRMAMAFQFFAGIFVSVTPTYLSEAFPMRVKGLMIGLIVCLEQVIHIVTIVTFGRNYDCFFQYFIAVGIILSISMIIFAVLMPETRSLTLRQAGERFRRAHDVMAY